jgi:hypothetical protein
MPSTGEGFTVLSKLAANGRSNWGSFSKRAPFEILMIGGRCSVFREVRTENHQQQHRHAFLQLAQSPVPLPLRLLCPLHRRSRSTRSLAI